MFIGYLAVKTDHIIGLRGIVLIFFDRPIRDFNNTRFCLRIVQVKAAALYGRSVPFNGAVPDRQLAISLTIYAAAILGSIVRDITEIQPFGAFTKIYPAAVSGCCIMFNLRESGAGIVYGYFCSGCYIHTATVSGCFI